jgi:hypothetical protein
MSFNPVRAASFYKNRKGTRHPDNPHAGTKHSDIVRRQGLGVTIPMADRTATATGLAAVLMANDKFVVRSEVIGSGNHLGLGMNKKQDRLLIIRVGSLFVQVNNEENPQESTFHRLQMGAHIKLPAGLVYKIAASGTEDSEVLFVEEPDYAAGFEYLERPETRGLSAESVLTGNTPFVTSERRTDQSVAKAQAVETATRTARRRPAKLGAAVAAAVTNANSVSVQGVNPRPMGAAALSDE